MPDPIITFRELEFEQFVAGLLDAHPQYSDVRKNPRIGPGLMPDLTAIRKHDHIEERLVIEVTAAPFMRPGLIRSKHRQIETYRNTGLIDVAVLIFRGRLPERYRATFEDAQIEVWDLDHIATTFANEIQIQPDSYLKQHFLLDEKTPPRMEADDLLRRLRKCPRGQSHWVEFQRIVKDIFEYLFVPPLGQAIEESSDASGSNRRDIILPNHTSSGFWKSMRDDFKAHYIVVEAKNWNKPINKGEALQVANYLKPYGAGMFALIAARNSASESCRQTIREQWTANQKMMVVLTEVDIESMLRIKDDGLSPEDVLVALIGDFRLSM